MTSRTISLPEPDNDDTNRWFDEQFANTVQTAREPSSTSFENYVQYLEHQDLLSSFKRGRRSPADK
jgi:hypothetical protein